ncbi:hypothetical protein BWI93_17395 [Siphonobacter sp. BAB-5385]|uniref:Uncharacterized protein n=1 Tax=Siphonobacter curvatus TaxID=2094562 RepID=A0A2S7ISL4_9BACT|nr:MULTISPECIES: hypothetical protein [Siphonobacter]OZI06910.1 hypothetical protein BWI93_17395 [Siphonobacter sp. BAB-5385]PMD98645.1 hypothetical protein BWI97_03710 [Siphonobacter sp. BAB-5405]PQA60695.1 hypothetical protein C5O19_14085 [Siphonobacter curvatus]
MFNLISILLGIVAFVIALAGLIPFIGIVNWVALPVAFIGLGFGAFSESKTGRNLNIFVLIVAILRLMLGGGIL